MSCLAVALVAPAEYAKSLGKKSTESDIGLYGYREANTDVSLVVPLRWPERIQPLAYALQIGHVAAFAVRSVDRSLGEAILAADATGHRRAVFLLQEYVQPDQIQPLLSGTGIVEPIFLADKPPEVRSVLAQFSTEPRQGDLRVPVDHHFEVKGIGPVVLGFVRQGTVHRHDGLRLYPTDKIAQVRSIQVHDQTVDQAPPGSHVGLALRDVQPADLDRGQVLAPEGTMQVASPEQSLPLEIQVSRWYRAGITPGQNYALSLGMQIIPVRFDAPLAAGGSGRLEARCRTWLAYEHNDRSVLYDLDAKGPRVVGPATIRST